MEVSEVVNLDWIYNQKCHLLQKNAAQPVLSKHKRNNRKLLASDRCLLNTGAFQCICLFCEMNTWLFNTGCLIDVATKTNFTVCYSHFLSRTIMFLK